MTNTAYLPVREFAEKLGYDVYWNWNDQEIILDRPEESNTGTGCEETAYTVGRTILEAYCGRSLEYDCGNSWEYVIRAKEFQTRPDCWIVSQEYEPKDKTLSRGGNGAPISVVLDKRTGGVVYISDCRRGEFGEPEDGNQNFEYENRD